MAIIQAALRGWAACLAAMLLLAFVLEPGLLQRLSGPNALGVLHRLSIYALWSGALAIPVGLMGGLLISYLLPPASSLWNPARAAAIGAFFGIMSVGIILPLLGRGVTLTDLTQPAFWVLAGLAGVDGGVCGYSLARSREKRAQNQIPVLHP